MQLLTIILVSISLSMDAFSLAICYGTLNLKNDKIILLSFIVGIYHFIMPQLGMLLGHLIKTFIFIKIKYIVFIIFFLLGLEILFFSKEENKTILLISLSGFLIFGFMVSIDSFSAGIGLNLISDKKLFCSFIFFFFSFLFTFLGLKIGKYLNKIYKDLALSFGGLMLIILSLFYLFN